MIDAQARGLAQKALARTNSETIGQKLRRLERAARYANPILTPPLQAAPAWQANTAYTLGNVVANGGNLYCCTTAGTSAGSGGPTGAAATAVTDNTAAWTYCGVANPTTSDPRVPTLTAFNGSSVTGLGNVYNVGSGVTDSVLKYCGGSAYNTGSGWYVFPAASLFGNQAGNASPHGNGVAPSVTFMTDAPKFAVAWNYPQNFRLIVDGVYVYQGQTLGGTGGGKCWAIFDFGSAGGRKAREITVEMSSAVNFYGVAVDPASTVWPVSAENSLRAIIMGDSWIAGANNFPTLNGGQWAVQMGRLLGWNDVWASGLGGTGYTTQGPSSYPKPSERLTDMTGNSPDIGIFAFGINDAGTSAATITAAAQSVFASARATLPTTPLVVFGVPNEPSISNANATAAENAIFAAVTNLGDSNIFTVPVTTDTAGAWFSGTGKTTATSGSGNNDAYISSDGVHMVDFGHAFMAQRAASAVRNVIRRIV